MSFRVLAALAVVAAAGGLCGCATTDGQVADSDHHEKVYRTGSNLPLRDPNAAHDRTLTVDPASLQGPKGAPTRPAGG